MYNSYIKYTNTHNIILKHTHQTSKLIGERLSKKWEGVVFRWKDRIFPIMHNLSLNTCATNHMTPGTTQIPF